MPVALPSLSGVTHRTLDVHGLAVHVAEAGQGPPLVLLHGWPQHWWCWRHVVPLLAPSYHLVMPDLRGHGWTAAPAGGYDKEQLASDLLGTLDSLGLDRVGLVGHDWGGWTGFLACLRAPERFSGFLALGITHPFQRVDRRVFQAWRASYQVALSTPMAAAALRVSPGWWSPPCCSAPRGARPSRRRTSASMARCCRSRHGPGRARCSIGHYCSARAFR